MSTRPAGPEGSSIGPAGIRSTQFGAFDLIRIVAALAVLFQHSFPVLDHPEPSWSAFGTYTLDFGKGAVAVFFVLSGFLITHSWRREPRIVPFAVRRIARIWPAFAVVILLRTRADRR